MHINQTELRAHLIEESRLSANVVSAKQLYGLDSQVSLGGLVKGRCSSKPFNSELSRSIPTQLGSDLYGFYMYFPSSANRADGPTRGISPPGPDVSLPEWWTLIDEEKFEAFDNWMQQQSSLISNNKRSPFDSVFPLDELKAHDKSPTTGDRTVDEAPVKPEEGLRGTGDTTESFSEHRSVSTLCSEALAILESFSDKQIFRAKGVVGFPAAGALDLYSGRAGIAKELVKVGCPWVLCFDWNRSADDNLLNTELQAKIFRLIDLRVFLLVGSALICSSMSKAVTPAVRSPRYPRGLPRIRVTMRQKVREGNQHADFTKEAIVRAEKVGSHFWVENPDSSYLWRMRGYQRFLDPSSSWTMRIDFCRFKTKWRKRTRFGTSIPPLRGLRMLCQGGHEHLVLRGMSRVHRRPWTSVAEPYPRGLCRLVAHAASRTCGWSKGKLQIASCAKAGEARIGEAANPGPRTRKAPRAGCLADTPIQSAATLALGSREWDLFLRWAAKFLHEDAMETFLTVPLFLVHALRRYGDLQFQSGSSVLLQAFAPRGATQSTKRKTIHVSCLGLCHPLAESGAYSAPTATSTACFEGDGLISLDVWMAQVGRSYLAGVFRHWAGRWSDKVHQKAVAASFWRFGLWLQWRFLGSLCFQDYVQTAGSHTAYESHRPIRCSSVDYHLFWLWQHFPVVLWRSRHLQTSMGFSFTDSSDSPSGGFDTRRVAWRRCSSCVSVEPWPAYANVAYEDQTCSNFGSVSARDRCSDCLVGFAISCNPMCSECCRILLSLGGPLT